MYNYQEKREKIQSVTKLMEVSKNKNTCEKLNKILNLCLFREINSSICIICKCMHYFFIQKIVYKTRKQNVRYNI